MVHRRIGGNGKQRFSHASRWCVDHRAKRIGLVWPCRNGTNQSVHVAASGPLPSALWRTSHYRSEELCFRGNSQRANVSKRRDGSTTILDPENGHHRYRWTEREQGTIVGRSRSS